MKKIFQPFERISRQAFMIMVLIQLFIALLLWHVSSNGLIPQPGKVASAFVTLISSRVLLDNILVSLGLTLKAMFFSIVITLVFAYLSVIPFFKSLTLFLVKCRYLTLTG
ncbi:MAG: hypothetical protein EOO01_27690, partial [Chitinophagaceae bacterium]